VARRSETGNVKKICSCVKWKECAHPWYVDYQEGKEVVDGKVRRRALRKLLAPLVGREPKDFADAKAEAQRAIVAWRDGLVATQLIPGDTPTVAALLAGYAERPGGAARDTAPIERVKINGRPFGEWPADAVTRDALEAFRAARPRVAANRDLALLRAAFNWGVLRGVVPATPFKVGTVAAVKLAREEARTRRLQPGEEERLLLAAGGLKDLIVAALETGCRRGELLSLQWHQVLGNRELFLPAGKTKAKKPRRVPISTVLRAVLDARRNDPAGEPLPPDAFVLGDEVGRRRGSIKTAWRLTRKRANITGLHFHDLRREAGSRWMDAGVPLATIQRWLGHHNISQTSTYLAASGGGDADAMRAFDQAMGRLRHVAESAGSTVPDATSSSSEADEKTQSNTVVH
jgi:integrase